MAGVLFEDIFDVKDIDPDGKKFERGMQSSLSKLYLYIVVADVYWNPLKPFVAVVVIFYALYV